MLAQKVSQPMSSGRTTQSQRGVPPDVQMSWYDTLVFVELIRFAAQLQGALERCLPTASAPF